MFFGAVGGMCVCVGGRTSSSLRRARIGTDLIFECGEHMWEFVYVTVLLRVGSPDVFMTVASGSRLLSCVFAPCVSMCVRRVGGIAFPLQTISV